MGKENNRKKGNLYEERAAAFLESKDHCILERNFRNRYGEIDIISFDRNEKCLVFTEVKYRATTKEGASLEAVTLRKQKKIIRVAEFYIMLHSRYVDISARFDVIAFDGDKLTYIENAFYGS